MKRINPLLTTNNPAPIPGCHAPVKAVAHSAVVIYCIFLKAENKENEQIEFDRKKRNSTVFNILGLGNPKK